MCSKGPCCLCKNKVIASQEVSKVEPSLKQTRELAWISATSISQAKRPDCIRLWTEKFREGHASEDFVAENNATVFLFACPFFGENRAKADLGSSGNCLVHPLLKSRTERPFFSTMPF